ncbi:GNAT family N-acetyltransferase [Streptomyces sp. MNU89]|uniref:GNAT family N-acetyltransferase n=1 Tax=Streptomyces sp. MNU89 TaxID=2560025 RepID=UPI001E3297F4|nr:GNAT family N-acetyltransferase [Streptomyces sp. MNU89]MCC9742141.1 acetyltransferase [Streptomyces sp. MNU89]
MSYWLYRADLDPRPPLPPQDPTTPASTSSLGPPLPRRGLGPHLIRAVSDHQLATDPRATRVLAEPDTRNTRSVHAFRRAGFHPAGELDLPGKKALLMIRDRPESAHRSATPHF